MRQFTEVVQVGKFRMSLTLLTLLFVLHTCADLETWKRIWEHCIETHILALSIHFICHCAHCKNRLLLSGLMNVCFLATPKDVSSMAPTYACHGFTLGVSASQVDKLRPHLFGSSVSCCQGNNRQSGPLCK